MMVSLNMSIGQSLEPIAKDVTEIKLSLDHLSDWTWFSHTVYRAESSEVLRRIPRAAADVARRFYKDK